jgi:uncharacterized protein (TIGR02466 family)
MEITEIFKTPIAKFVLNEDTNALTKFSREWAKKYPSVYLSNKGGYQSPNLDLNIPELRSLREQTTRCFNKVKEKFFYPRRLTIANMWLNVNYPHSSNELHSHPRCCLASSFYISVPENSGNIVFCNNYEMEHYMDQKFMTQFGAYNSSLWTVPVKDNDFYVFPAWLKHKVEINKSKEDRISISINASH